MTAESENLRLTPAFGKSKKYHIERVGRYGYNRPGYTRFALCGAYMRPVTREVALSAVEPSRRCKACFKHYENGSR